MDPDVVVRLVVICVPELCEINVAKASTHSEPDFRRDRSVDLALTSVVAASEIISVDIRATTKTCKK